MRIFVASWFFPPATSSEGIVSYKLFRNSRHQYDVCSSLSTQWSYQQTLPIEADNINSFPIETNDFEVWIEKAVEIFEAQHAQRPYDAIMTRSMPPESILVAKRIREAHPQIPWIASLGDPVAKEPYHIQGLVLESEILTDEEKAAFPMALKLGCGAWKSHDCNEVRYMCNLKEVEDYALNNAAGLGFPCDTLKNYVLSGRQRKNAFSIPHSFDRSLYRTPQAQREDPRTTLTFLGHSDSIRSLEPIVRAAHHLKSRNIHGLDNLHIRFIGNVPENVRALVYNYYLHNTISIEPSVDYLTSLEVMQESDWLVHVDAKFDFLSETGNSIYFAGKLADYMGTDTPILAITGRYSPADEIVRKAGGLCLEQDDIGGIAEAFDAIANHGITPTINRAYRDQYDAVSVAATYDDTVEAIVSRQKTDFVRTFWPIVNNHDDTNSKLLTICVPSYKVECYLDRCLFSLITSDIASRLQIIVVNDGSPDSSREIGLAYQEHYPHIVKLVDKENGGHGSTINTALEHATGLYFRVLDGDDWIDGKNLTSLLETIESNELYADLVSANYHQVFCEDGAMIPWMKKGELEYNTIYDFTESGFTTEYFTIHSTMMKTAILKQANFKIQEHTYYVDVEYGLFPIPYIQTVMFAPEYVYRYAVGNADQSINPDVFVTRYDHHDRVMRRMLSYLEENRSSMSPGQIDYVESMFDNHFLKTHYTLSLLWDPDKERGSARAKDFDTFLEQTNPKLRASARSKYRAVKEAQNSNFNPALTAGFISIEDGFSSNSVHAVLKKAARSFSTTSVGKKIAYNRVTESIANRLFH